MPSSSCLPPVFPPGGGLRTLLPFLLQYLGNDNKAQSKESTDAQRRADHLARAESFVPTVYLTARDPGSWPPALAPLRAAFARMISFVALERW